MVCARVAIFNAKGSIMVGFGGRHAEGRTARRRRTLTRGGSQVHPTDPSVIQRYVLAKSQESRAASVGINIKTAISLEPPLTRDDVINFGLNSGM